MKNIKDNNIDVIAEARKHPNWERYSKEADLRVRLAVEVYNARNQMNVSQQELAKQISSTQKVISNIENAEVNIGIAQLGRVSKALNFNSSTFGKIFDSDVAILNIMTKSEKSFDIITKTGEEEKVEYFITSK